MIRVGSAEAEAALRELEARRSEASSRAFAVADAAIAGVRERGDAFVAEQIARFDGVSLEPEQILMAPAWPADQSGGMAAALQSAIERIEAFHLAQLPRGYTWRSGDTTIEHRVKPLRRVGIYVPGGRAVYVSTLIMCAVPARIAGVEDLVVATTPAAAARPELQYACARLGVREIYQAGGAAGIAALALGTQTLRRVDKIVGPGNSYVTAAKARLIGEVGIDMTAGPTELVVIADETANADLVNADLAAQAEHGPDSAVICITTSERLDVKGAFFAASIDDAIALVNRLAPEHLSIQTRNPEAVAARIENCGAIYCGPWSAPAAGDYILGCNHVLPTAGSARFFSPLGVYDFVKRSNVITAGPNDLASVADKAEAIARFEGLSRHAESIAVREKVTV